MFSGMVFSSLPPDQSALLGVEPQYGDAAEKFTSAFLKTSVPKLGTQDLEDVLLHKAVVMQFARQKKMKGKKVSHRGLNARERRQLKVFELKPEHQKYELFLPLHDLWKQYITDLCNGLKPGSNPQMLQQKLLKADFHGAILTVVRSKCPSYVGTTGILVQELKHIFKIITKENRLKVIPKRNSVFSVEMGNFVTHIYGSKFELRSSERSAKKFKMRGTIDL
ncbi:ribonuclease P protein subunit p29 isoform X2 [Electrophorus electricus]|uniref:ribonuclease P protein subunit p29 isoform X2 n=1 Tax=Electrophorus electricus TaxID=8005 RepID=UPI0015D02D73|nr:ribonuclease P protein subunit p29 isoform X2 [Electrophorus electricus]